MLIDTHCHLYTEEFDSDRSEALARCRENDIRKILLPAIDSETHSRLAKLVAWSCSELELIPMMGLHPCSVKKNMEDELALVQQKLDSNENYCAVGEIGLDYYWDLSFKAQQVQAFETQIEWAIKKNLPVAIHSRQSTSDCIESVHKFSGRAKGVFHCFSGTLAEAKEIMDLGMYLGIGGVVTYKKTDLREILQKVGLSQVVLETDAPYLPPVPYRGKRNEPSYVKLVAEAIATAMQIRYDDVADITTQNAMRLFQLNH